MKLFRKFSLSTAELVLFSVLGAIMFCSRILLQAFPNIHLLGMFIITFTLVFRKKALIPLYVYVLLEGIFAGFGLWWLPYLYIWLPLYFAAMLLPRNMKKGIAIPVYMLINALHGILYGTLYAPAQALIFGLSFDGMIAWIVAGLPFDAMHAIGNAASGLLVVPLYTLIKRITKNMHGI